MTSPFMLLDQDGANIQRSISTMSEGTEAEIADITEQINEYRSGLLSTLEQDNAEGNLPHYKQLKQLVGSLTQLSTYALQKSKQSVESIQSLK